MRLNLMLLNIFNAILGISFSAVGIFAFSYSELFFSLLGNYYGTFNNHFVKDAGIAFFCSGFLLLLSIKMISWRVPLTLGGAIFIILHGIFHIQMLIMGMAPTFSDVIKELLIVITPSMLTAVLLFLRIKQQG